MRSLARIGPAVTVTLALVFAVAPAAGAQTEQPQTIAGIRFHGNYSIPDAELLRVAGVDIGDPLTAATRRLIEQRLRDHDRVGSLEIRERYRSLNDTSQVVLLIVIKESVSVADKFMFLPVFSWTDEYGITYGARFTTIDLLGAGERLSFPLTWGGEKQAAVEPSLQLDRAALTRLEGGFGVLRRTNPHFDIDDTRQRAWVRGLKRWGIFEIDADMEWADVTFAEFEGPQITYGFGARLDTRQDIQLPRNAMYLGAGVEHLELLDGGMSFNQPELDIRGYKSFIGRSIIASQFYYRGTDGRLPAWERPFLGGAATLRGYDAGEFIGDNIMLASVELRVPLTPPLPVGLVGLDFFFDTGHRIRLRHGPGQGQVSQQHRRRRVLLRGVHWPEDGCGLRSRRLGPLPLQHRLPFLAGDCPPCLPELLNGSQLRGRKGATRECTCFSSRPTTAAATNPGPKDCSATAVTTSSC